MIRLESDDEKRHRFGRNFPILCFFMCYSITSEVVCIGAFCDMFIVKCMHIFPILGKKKEPIVRLLRYF